MKQLRFRSTLGSCIRRLLPLSIILVLLLAALPAQAAQADNAPPVEDQSFTTPKDASYTILPPPGSVSVAQTFTVGVTGALQAVSIDLATVAYQGWMSVWLLGVTNGVPNDTSYWSWTLGTADLQTMTADPLSFKIPMPGVYVRKGEQYAIVVHYTSYEPENPPISVWSGATGNRYTRGSAFINTDGFGPNWQPLSDPSMDLHFRTFVVTGVPISDLSLVRTRGADKATACREFSEIYTVKNNGPDTAEKVWLTVGGTDQFDLVSVKSFPGGKTGPFTLAPGHSMQFKAVMKVTAFVPGESRQGEIGAHVFLEDNMSDFRFDLNPDNDVVQTVIWLQGQPRTSCR